MKIQQVVPPRPNNAALARQIEEDTPLDTVLIASYGPRTGNGPTDLMLRTGMDGWLWVGRYPGQAYLPRRDLGSYYANDEARRWILHHLDQGAEFHRVLVNG